MENMENMENMATIDNMIRNITVNEHSSIRVEAEKILYIDPVEIKTDAHDADIIFITHPHSDHFLPETIQRIAKNDTVFVIPASMEDEFLKSGLDNEYFPAKPGKAYEILGIVFETVRAYNVNKKFHKKEYDWLGYVLNVFGKRLYICGDTDITDEAKSINCDVLMVPIGGTYTMNAAEAAELTNIIKPKTVIPEHYGTIVGVPEAVNEFKKLVGPDTVIVEKLHF